MTSTISDRNACFLPLRGQYLWNPEIRRSTGRCFRFSLYPFFADRLARRTWTSTPWDQPQKRRPFRSLETREISSTHRAVHQVRVIHLVGVPPVVEWQSFFARGAWQAGYRRLGDTTRSLGSFYFATPFLLVLCHAAVRFRPGFGTCSCWVVRLSEEDSSYQFRRCHRHTSLAQASIPCCKEREVVTLVLRCRRHRRRRRRRGRQGAPRQQWHRAPLREPSAPTPGVRCGSRLLGAASSGSSPRTDGEHRVPSSL